MEHINMLIMQLKKQEVKLGWDFKRSFHRRGDIWMKSQIWTEGR